MEKKNIEWSKLGFGYMPVDYRFVAHWKDGSWDEGGLTKDASVTISESAGVLQYAQTCFEGLKVYTQKNGDIVAFRPDLNAKRLQDSADRLLLTMRWSKQMTNDFLHMAQVQRFISGHSSSDPALSSE